MSQLLATVPYKIYCTPTATISLLIYIKLDNNSDFNKQQYGDWYTDR